MRFLKPLLATWACLAQVSLAGVAFTKWPTTIYTGQPATLYWKGDPNAPAKITLRQGPSGDLQTMKVLTDQATGGSFTWAPEAALPAGSDYAFQIEQDGSINYSSRVTLAPGPGEEPAVTSASTISLPSDTTPLGGTRPTVQKGNNGYIPTLNSPSTRINMTSGKSTVQSPTNDGVTFRNVSPEMALAAVAAVAAVIYFAA
ncbi:GPI anchored serine-threonine rich family protein [Aspergillus undulatus]|uniref:GPI anchored serine-threonine rich family protein n=1 Tax=Aspergillus undulatus TaxID=1810928 RepID=UPI003CCCD581